MKRSAVKRSALASSTLAGAAAVCLMAWSAGSQAALPTVLYDRPLSDPWWDLTDNSGLTKIILTKVLLDQRTTPTVKWDITNTSTKSPNTYNVELTWTKGYTKSFTETTNTEVNGELSAEFKGIGGKIGGSYSHALEIQQEMSKTTEEKISTSCTLGCLENGKYKVGSIFDEFAGTYEWFDDVGPHTGGLTRFGNWSARVYYGHTLEGPILSGGVPCIPEPGTWLLMLAGLGLLGSASMRRRTSLRA